MQMTDRPVQRSFISVALGTLLTLTAIAWVVDVPRWLAWELFTEQFLAAVLALALPLAFTVLAQRRDLPRSWRRAYAAMALIAGAALAYVALRYPALQSAYMDRPWHGVALGALILLLVLAAVRRCCGTALFVL